MTVGQLCVAVKPFLRFGARTGKRDDLGFFLLTMTDGLVGAVWSDAGGSTLRLYGSGLRTSAT